MSWQDPLLSSWEAGEVPAGWKPVNVIPIYRKSVRKDPGAAWSDLFCSVLAWDELQYFRSKHCLKTESWCKRGRWLETERKQKRLKKIYDWIAMKSRFENQIAFQSPIDMHLSTNNTNFCKMFL